MRKAARNETDATPTPESARIRLMITAIRPTPAINPTSAPTSFGDAFGRIGSCQPATLAATITLLNE